MFVHIQKVEQDIKDDGEVEKKKLQKKRIKPKDVYANCLKNLFFSEEE